MFNWFKIDRYWYWYRERKAFLTHPNIQSPVNGSQSPAQSHGRQPYSWKPQYPTMHLSQWAPPTPGLQMQFPLEGSHSEPSAKWKGMEPKGLQLHAGRGKFRYKALHAASWHQCSISINSDANCLHYDLVKFVYITNGVQSRKNIIL